MAYLGRGLDKISNIEVLDNITFDGSSSYSITKGSVAFTPNSAQSCLISIDGVVQATNFSVNSSTIDFGVAIPSTSTCNFFLHYGTGVMTVPSDGSVTTAKLGDGAVTSAKLSSGKVLQVVQGTTETEVTVTGITFTDTTLTASITPISTSSKILILTSQSYYVRRASSAYALCGARLLRGTTTIWNPNPEDSSGSYGHGIHLLGTSTTTSAYGTIDFNYLDSPSTTSATTYKTQIRGYTSTGIVSVQENTSFNPGASSIILMEISG
jgi:hypothetical protein